MANSEDSGVTQPRCVMREGGYHFATCIFVNARNIVIYIHILSANSKHYLLQLQLIAQSSCIWLKMYTTSHG